MDADDHEDYWESLADVVFERVWELAGQRLPETPVVVRAIETPPTRRKRMRSMTSQIGDYHQRLVDKYGADPAADIDAPRGWRTLVETVFKTLYETDVEAPSKVAQVKEKFGQLRIHLVYDGPSADHFFKYIAAAEDRALRTCSHCGGPGHMRTEWPIKSQEVVCDACLSHARVLDQLDRRRTELVSAARDWCAKSAKAGHWLKPSEYALHRWRKDGEIKREAMRQAFRLLVSELDLLSVRYRPKQVADFEAYQQLVDKIDVDDILLENL